MSKFAAAATSKLTTVRAAAQRALRAGQWCAGSGALEWPDGRLALHSDFGPRGQDKDENQDFVAGWKCNVAQVSNVSWAVALADGVTSSYYAAVAAELACWSALTRLTACDGNPGETARQCADAAGAAIGKLADIIAASPEAYCPAGEFASTWRYTLREGLLLQTTLTLAWQDQQQNLYLAVVGDGGAQLELGDGLSKSVEALGGADEATSRVHALGPRNRRVEQFDHWETRLLTTPFRLAFYTDGVGRTMDLHPGRLSAELDEASFAEGRNEAEHLIQRWAASGEPEFEDNLTLVVVRQQ